MTIRPALPFLPVILLATWFSSGCEHSESDTMINPSRIGSSDAPFVSRADMVEPQVVVAAAVPFALCPVTPPFLAPVNITVHGNAVSDLTLRGVQMQFTDLRGTRAGFQTFTHVDLVTRFGSTAIPVFGTRTFPLSFPFGCLGVPAGTLNVGVIVADADGRERRSSHRVRVTEP